MQFGVHLSSTTCWLCFLCALFALRLRPLTSAAAAGAPSLTLASPALLWAANGSAFAHSAGFAATAGWMRLTSPVAAAIVEAEGQVLACAPMAAVADVQYAASNEARMLGNAHTLWLNRRAHMNAWRSLGLPDATLTQMREDTIGWLPGMQGAAARARETKIVMSAVCRNNGPAIAQMRSVMERVGRAFRDYRVIMYENDSADDTAAQLRAWAGANPKVGLMLLTVLLIALFSFLVLSPPSLFLCPVQTTSVFLAPSQVRFSVLRCGIACCVSLILQVRAISETLQLKCPREVCIATARNTVMPLFYSDPEYASFDHFLFADCDFPHPITVNAVVSTFLRNDWTVACANGVQSRS